MSPFINYIATISNPPALLNFLGGTGGGSDLVLSQTVPVGTFVAVGLGAISDGSGTITSVDVSDTKGNGWTVAEHNYGDFSNVDETYAGIAYCILTVQLVSGDRISFSINGGSALDYFIAAASFSNIAAAPRDRHTGQFDTASSVHSSGVTALRSTPRQVLIGVHTPLPSAFTTVSASLNGFTSLYTATLGGSSTAVEARMQYKIVTSAGTDESSIQFSRSSGCWNSISTFKGI